MVLFQGEGNDLAALIINGGNGDDFVTIDASVDGNTFAPPSTETTERIRWTAQRAHSH